MYPHAKCSVLFLRGQLWTLPLSWRQGRGLGPASLLGQPVGPCPGIRRLVKSPGAWGPETEAQVLQVSWWLPRRLKYREPCKHGVGGASASARPPTLFPRCLAHCGGVGQPDPWAHSLGKAFS